MTKLIPAFVFLFFVSVNTPLLAASIGSSSSDPTISAKHLQSIAPGSSNGFYWFDPDGPGVGTVFQTFADMTTAGGGWMMGLHSIAGSESPSTDITSNLGAASLLNGFTRDLSVLAVTAQAQIRHRVTATSGAVLFDGYYTGKYHDPLGSNWTVLAGSLAAVGLDYHLGMAWSTPTSPGGDCARIIGQPWYYGLCWRVLPTGYDNANGPQRSDTQEIFGSYDVYIRELSTPSYSTNVPEPSSIALIGLGFASMAARRRQSIQA